MAAYLLRRLLLVIPTLLGIMLINFTLTQFVPGGPIEQVLARIEGEGDAFANIAGGGSEVAADSSYVGARGLPPEFIAELEVQFGFARIVCDPPPPEVRRPPRASNSSKKITHGAAARALRNTLRIAFSLSPSHLPSSSARVTWIKEAPRSPAMARAM